MNNESDQEFDLIKYWSKTKWGIILEMPEKINICKYMIDLVKMLQHQGFAPNKSGYYEMELPLEAYVYICSLAMDAFKMPRVERRFIPRKFTIYRMLIILVNTSTEPNFYTSKDKEHLERCYVL